MKMKNAVGGHLSLSKFLLLFLALFAVGSFNVNFFLWRYNQTIMTNRKHFKKKSTNTEPHKREMKMVQKNVPLSRLICLCRPFHNLSLEQTHHHQSISKSFYIFINPKCKTLKKNRQIEKKTTSKA